MPRQQMLGRMQRRTAEPCASAATVYNDPSPRCAVCYIQWTDWKVKIVCIP